MLPLINQVEKASNLLDPEDFQTNQKNQISASQQQRIKQISWARLKLMLFEVGFWGFVLAVPCVVMVVTLSGILQSLSEVLPFLPIPFLILFLVSAPKLISETIWNFKLKRDYDNQAIRQGQGQLSHSQKGYSFALNNGVRLRLLANESNGLLPGVDYRVFYLEESGFCLSAAETRQKTSSQVQNALNKILCTVNGFSSEDLRANHQGKVTFSQRWKPFTKVLIGSITLLSILLVLALPLALAPFSLNFKLSGTDAVWIVVLAIVMFLSGGVLITLGALIDTVFPSLKQIQGNVYKTIRTEWESVGRGRRRVTRYYYEIGDRSFEVNKRAYTALIDELEYRIYYLPRTNQLISIENLSAKTNPSLF